MAKKENEKQEVVQGKKKKGGLFLKICIALAVLSALILGGWFVTSSIVFLRNAIYLTAAAGVGVAVATPVVKGIGNAIAKSKEEKRSRVRARERVRERSQEQTLGNVPTPPRHAQEDTLDWQPIARPTKPQNRSNGNRG